MPKISAKDYPEEYYLIEEALSGEATEGILSKEQHSTKRNSFPNARIQGRKLKSDEISKLMAEHKRFCGYLREPHKFDGVFTGLCAICNFTTCQYPRILYNSSENDCPTYISFNKELERRAKGMSYKKF